MSDVALRFLIANLAAGVAILVALLLRKPARNTLGPRLAYGLWLLVPLAALGSQLPPRVIEVTRQAMPALAPDTGAEIAVAAPDGDDAMARNAPDVNSAMPVASSDMPVRMKEIIAPAVPAPPATPDLWAMGFALWLVGVIAMAAWLARNQLRFMADARAGFAGPAVVGLFRPRIITPSDFEERFERPERDVILAHENAHLARYDAQVNAMVTLARCLCWFNPLVHIAAHLMRIDQELACDASVVARHPKARAVYALALLKAQLAARPLPLGCYWPAGDEHPLTERVEMLKRAAPGRARRMAGAGAIAFLCMAAGATAWAVVPAQHRMVDPQEQDARVEPAPAPQQQAAADQASPLPPQMRMPRTNVGFLNQGVSVPLDRDAAVYLRGKVEAMEFGPASYVVRVRAYGISKDGGFLKNLVQPNSEMWELSPTHYFGDPASIRADLMGMEVEVRGAVLNADCKPGCKLKVKDLFTQHSSEAPAMTPSDSMIGYFTAWYDTALLVSVLGTVERMSFSDRTFDYYVRTKERAGSPSRLYQIRSEYTQPRADIERALMGKRIVAQGWFARQRPGNFCAPVCGVFAETIVVREGDESVLVKPASPVLTAPTPAASRGLTTCPLPAGVAVNGAYACIDEL